MYLKRAAAPIKSLAHLQALNKKAHEDAVAFQKPKRVKAYTPDQLKAALLEVVNATEQLRADANHVYVKAMYPVVKQTAERHGVPLSTLCDHFKKLTHPNTGQCGSESSDYDRAQAEKVSPTIPVQRARDAALVRLGRVPARNGQRGNPPGSAIPGGMLL